MTNAVRRSRRLGIIGSAVGLLALLVSALTYLLPETLLYKPIPQVTEAAGKKETEQGHDLPHQAARAQIARNIRAASGRHHLGTSTFNGSGRAGPDRHHIRGVRRHLSRRETAGGYRGHTRRRSHRGPGVVGSGRRGARDGDRQRLSVLLRVLRQARCSSRVAINCLIDAGIGTGRWVAGRYRPTRSRRSPARQCRPSKDGEFEHEARIADPRHPRADVEFPVEQHRRLVFDQRLDDVEVEPGRFGIGI